MSLNEGSGPGRKPAWTDEEIEQLKKLVAERYSATEIGVLMGRVRNAVLGKCNRLGITLQGAGCTPQERSRRSALAQRNKRMAAVPVSLPAVPALPPAVPDALEGEDEIPAATAEQGDAVTILTLRPCHCRWPLGDPSHESFRFCGAPRVVPSSYCASHNRLSRVPGSGRPKSRAQAIGASR